MNQTSGEKRNNKIGEETGKKLSGQEKLLGEMYILSFIRDEAEFRSGIENHLNMHVNIIKK